MAQFNTPKPPLPEPLKGAESGSFAHFTVTVRLHELARLALTENNFPAGTVARLETLLAEIPDAPLRALEDPGAPDVEDWDHYLDRYQGQNWLQVPWFFAETYFYRRILEATGYFQPGPGQGLDPYAGQKRQVLEVSWPAIQSLCDQLNGWLASGLVDREVLYRLLLLNLWGNQADLSMWPAGLGERPDHQELHRQQSHLLVDHSPAALAHLLADQTSPARVDFISDNAGLELANDLALADYLLTTQVTPLIIFHLKAHPTYISDAMIVDVQDTIRQLAAAPTAGMQDLGARLKDHLQSGRLRFEEHFYWNSPLSFWELPFSLRAHLSQASLLISKGDANYRRLLGDRHWPPDMPVEAVLRYVPAPLLALRVLKAEIITGLQPGQAENIARQDPQWLISGNWGVIQFVKL